MFNKTCTLHNPVKLLLTINIRESAFPHKTEKGAPQLVFRLLRETHSTMLKRIIDNTKSVVLYPSCTTHAQRVTPGNGVKQNVRVENQVEADGTADPALNQTRKTRRQICHALPPQRPGPLT